MQEASPVMALERGLMVERVSKTFVTSRGKVAALQDISLAVPEGEFLCIVGPSGCGKSTLLDIIAGLTSADSGMVLEHGKKITGPGRDRLVMFQDAALFPWLNVTGNVMFGLKLCPDLSAAERQRRAQDHIELVGLSRFASAYMHELSGGMRQRVALARALAPDPEILLMDEPMAALDALTREQLYSDIQTIYGQRRKTVILVTHNVREAVCLGDRVVLMSPRPGRVQQSFSIDLPRPRDVNDPQISRRAQEITLELKALLPQETVR